MKSFWKLMLTVGVVTCAPHMVHASEPATDVGAEKVIEDNESVLADMFRWLNKVYASDQAFTAEGFSQFFTEDILFIVNGKNSEDGLAAVAQRYNNLKARKAHLEILFPFEEEERIGNKIFTYYLNHGWMDDANPLLITTHVMGYVEVEGDKISLLNFVSADVEAES